MDALSYFAADYTEARDRFLDAARGAEARRMQYRNPAEGPGGTELFTHTATLGPEKAKTTLLITSGTHGAEGFFGSALQIGLLRGPGLRRLPPDLRVVLVHAINPSGFAWIRRVNEDNIDLNRNFIDHNNQPTKNEGYAALHSAILPETWNADSKAAFQAAFAAYAKEHGQFAAEGAVSGGQYDHADGLFYGGRTPSWSNRLIRQIVAEEAERSERLIFLDLHTGLGSWGHIEIIHTHAPDGENESWLTKWFGTHSLGSLVRGDSKSAASSAGLMERGVKEAFAGKPVVACALEAGTRPIPQVLESLRADNWLHLKGDLASDQGRAMKRELLTCFCPPEPDWRELVSLRGRQIFASAVEGALD
ncbi:MAG: M14 family metallopeptidase [Pseudomonadota bacterium]